MSKKGVAFLVLCKIRQIGQDSGDTNLLRDRTPRNGWHLRPTPAVATAGSNVAMTGTTGLDAGNTAKKEQDVEVPGSLLIGSGSNKCVGQKYVWYLRRRAKANSPETL